MNRPARRASDPPQLDPGHPDAPWTPSDCYPDGPLMCPCGHHEGFHGHNGSCRWTKDCGCTGLPVECYTPIPGHPLPRRYTRT
jgi:hypothetical protein